MNQQKNVKAIINGIPIENIGDINLGIPDSEIDIESEKFPEWKITMRALIAGKERAEEFYNEFVHHIAHEKVIRFLSENTSTKKGQRPTCCDAVMFASGGVICTETDNAVSHTYTCESCGLEVEIKEILERNDNS